MRQTAGRAAAMAAGLLAVITVSGCGQQQPGGGCSTEAQPGLAIAVGARANVPAPAVTSEIDEVITQMMDGGKAVTVIRVDGRPTVSCSFVFRSTARNEPAKLVERSEFKNKVQMAVTGVRAREPEANILAALGMAGAAAGGGGTVALIDSGLQTVAPMDLRKDLLDAQPKEIVDALRQSGQLPALKDVRVILSGIGYTAPPQAVLDEERRTRMVQLWTSIVEAGGGTATVVRSPATTAALTNVPTVGTVDVPVDTITIGCGTQSVLSDDGAVGFVPDTPNFIRPQEAEKTLSRFSEWIKTHPRARFEILGNVAHYGTDQGDGGLARTRALRVREELVRLGVDEGRVSARGDGWGPFPSKTAPPDKKHDQANRRVVVNITC